MTEGGQKAGAALAALAFFICVVYIPGAVNSATALRWALMAVGAPLILMILTNRIPNPLGGDGLIAVGIMFISILWCPDWMAGADQLVHLTILVSVFSLGAAVRNPLPVWKGLSVGMTISALIAIPQLYGWQGIHQNVEPAGLFENKNMLGEAALAALIPLVFYRIHWLWLAGPAVGVALAGSKGVYAGFIIAMAAAVWPRNRGIAAVSIAGMLLVGMLLANHLSFTARLELWIWSAKDMTWLGNGIASYQVNYPVTEFPHSELVQVFYEYGLLASVPVAVLIKVLRGPHEAERAVLLAILTVGLFSFPLHLPVTGFVAAFAAGRLAAGRGGVPDPQPQGGVRHAFAGDPGRAEAR